VYRKIRKSERGHLLLLKKTRSLPKRSRKSQVTRALLQTQVTSASLETQITPTLFQIVRIMSCVACSNTCITVCLVTTGFSIDVHYICILDSITFSRINAEPFFCLPPQRTQCSSQCPCSCSDFLLHDTMQYFT
jgi:hypothetical protein